jgi:hypothetical protein
MANPPSWDTKTTEVPILKHAIPIGPNVIVFPFHKSLVEHFQITEDTVFQQEIVEGGILLRIIRKDIS